MYLYLLGIEAPFVFEVELQISVFTEHLLLVGLQADIAAPAERGV